MTLTACGKRAYAEQTFIGIKALYLHSPDTLVHLHITHDNSAVIKEHLLCRLASLVGQQVINSARFKITASVTTNPKDLNELFGQCATARFTLPDEHPDWDAIIYMDVDTLVLEDIGQLWREFAKFNDTQWCGLAEEQEHNHDWRSGHDNWYEQKRRHYERAGLLPFKNGMNSGVLLWNLTRFRQGKTRPNFVNYSTKMLRTRTKDFWMPDQDALNTYFRMHPEQLYTIPCRWNYRLDSFCWPRNDQFRAGMGLLHGNRKAFLPYTDPGPMSKKELKWQTEHRVAFQRAYDYMVAFREDIWGMKQPPAIGEAACGEWLRGSAAK